MKPEGRRPAGVHTPHLAALGLDQAATGRISIYLDLLAEWSARVNLTGLRTPDARVAVLVKPILPARDVPAPGRLLDVGAGNGSPGLVLAAVREDLEVTLLEPRLKRWAFLRQAARRMGLRVTILRERHDSYSGPSAQTVTMRALALPLAELLPLAAPGGQIMVFGGRAERPADGASRDIRDAVGACVCRVFRVPRETQNAPRSLGDR